MEIINFTTYNHQFRAFKIKSSYVDNGKKRMSTDAFMVFVRESETLTNGKVLQQVTVSPIGTYQPAPFVKNYGYVCECQIIVDCDESELLFSLEKAQKLFKQMMQTSFFRNMTLESVENL